VGEKNRGKQPTRISIHLKGEQVAKIEQFMEETLLSVEPNASVTDAAKLMQEKKVGALLVSDESQHLGIVTSVDFSHKVLANELDPAKTKIADIMAKPLISLDRDQSMKDAYRCMHQHNIRHLAVTDDNEVVGILSVKDFANYYYHEVENEALD
jgi:signal-transduction protein with cAMP-binding, CBS, and nucleotidyltransferase domain